MRTGVLIAVVLLLVAGGAAPARGPATSPSAVTRPSPAAAKPLGKERYQAFAMTHGGNGERGKALFLDTRRLACGRCHSTDGKGGSVGPDLFAVGDKFGRRELVEAVLRPSATIAVGYSTTIVRTRDGEVYAGIVKDATADAVTLAGVDGERVRIEAAEIAEQRTSDVSIMPDGLEAGLSPQEFTDVIEYLVSLKAPETLALNERGMPATISMIDRPVALRPFHADEHRFHHPVWFSPVPGLHDVFAVVEHETGTVWLLDKSGAGETKTVFLETGKVMPGTRGLLGMVFHPGFATNRRYFIFKHLVKDGRFTSYVLEGEATPDLRADSGKPLRTVLRFDESSNVHYGGGLAFGPDGYLYVGMGDGGPQQDPRGRGQDFSVLLGKMLRIDVDHAPAGEPYRVPADNPFVGRAGARPEIWATGLREPWRFSFDPATGDLWVGDVGQDLYEEVDVVRRGENYGWNVFEGFAPFSNERRRAGERYVPPVFAYSRKYGASVTGGFVYRGERNSSFYGAYVVGDYQTSRVFALTQTDRTLGKVRQIAQSPQHVVSFGQGEHGELFLVGYEGTIYRIDFSGAEFR
jgi:putative heme-binding domain-containing protein